LRARADRHRDCPCYGCGYREPLGLEAAIKGSVLAKESSDEDLQAHVEGLIDAGFSECASSLNRSNASVEYLALRGDPKSLVTGRSEIKADLVVVGIRDFTASRRVVSAVIGSMTGYVMRRPPCPTLVVRLHR
jgi:nucleotide-binding universal stress UspA family protein